MLGDGVHYFIACEAALKLKELAYIHAEAMPSGELKHGPLALLDSSSYVLVFNPSDSTYPNTLAMAHEVKARGVKIIGVSDRPNDDLRPLDQDPARRGAALLDPGDTPHPAPGVSHGRAAQGQPRLPQEPRQVCDREVAGAGRWIPTIILVVCIVNRDNDGGIDGQHVVSTIGLTAQQAVVRVGPGQQVNFLLRTCKHCDAELLLGAGDVLYGERWYHGQLLGQARSASLERSKTS